MPVQISVQIPLVVMPLASYWAMLPAENRPELDELQRRCRAGRLPGAFKYNGSQDWYINQIQAMQCGAEYAGDTTQGKEEEEGNGERSPEKGEVPREMEDRGQRRVWTSEGDVRRGGSRSNRKKSA